jgi:type II secretory pathway pseudopilin PulG
MKRQARIAFSLVEVTLALGIGSICLLAVVALLPIGINSNQTSVNQTSATGIAAAIVADLRTTVAANKTNTLSQTGVFHIPWPFAGTTTLFLDEVGQLSGDANQEPSATNSPAPKYRATISFTVPGGKNATVTQLLITWPALADPAVASSPSNYTGSYQVATALDVN